MPASRFDEVGVVVGELERGGALLGDVRQRDDGRTDAQQQTDDATPQPERLGDTAGELALKPLVERGQSLRDDLRPERRRSVDLVGELLRSREPKQVRAVDIDDVQRDGHAGGSTGFGHELIGDQMRGHLVENARDLNCHRLALGPAVPAAWKGIVATFPI